MKNPQKPFENIENFSKGAIILAYLSTGSASAVSKVIGLEGSTSHSTMSSDDGTVEMIYSYVYYDEPEEETDDDGYIEEEDRDATRIEVTGTPDQYLDAATGLYKYTVSGKDATSYTVQYMTSVYQISNVAALETMKEADRNKLQASEWTTYTRPSNNYATINASGIDWSVPLQCRYQDIFSA